MRKTQKSSIYDCFKCVNIKIDNTNNTYIIDGGYILHRIVWDREETFNAIFEKYSKSRLLETRIIDTIELLKQNVPGRTGPI